MINKSGLFVTTAFSLLLLLCLSLQSAFAHPPFHGPSTPSAIDGRSHSTELGRSASASKAARKQWEAIGLNFIRSLNAQEKAYYALHGKYENTM